LKLLLYIILIFCFFPYVDIFHLGTDTQPNALLLGILALVCLKDKIINTPLILLWITFFLAILLFFFNELGLFLYVKNTLNYLSPPIVAMAVFNLMSKLDMKVDFRFFLGVVIAYLFVALVQLYINQDFMTFLLTENTRGNLYMGRGVISLSPEPAFYGSQCLFLMIFSFLSYDKRENLITLPLLLFQIFFLSRSSTAIVILAAAFLLFTLYQIIRLRLSYIIVVSLTLLISIPIVQNKFAELEKTRAGGLTMEFIEDPLLITKVDESVGVRFTYMASPFLAMKHNYFMPMGLGQFKPFVVNLYKEGKYRNFLGPYLIKQKDRITGSINMILFQLGFLGLLFPIGIYLAYKKLLSREAVVFSFILFIALLFTQIQLMHSMIGLIIAHALIISQPARNLQLKLS